MKDLIDQILGYLPKYLAEFGSVVSGPKQFIGQKNTNTNESFTQSLLFLAISVALGTIMISALLPPEKDIWMYLGVTAVSSLLGVSLSALALRASWRIVGGKAPVRSFFVTYAYYTGVILIFVMLVILLSEGIFKVFEPDLYEKIRLAKANKQPVPEMSASTVPLISLLILIVGFLGSSIWGFIGWGAYRQLNNLSKGRSFGALLIMGPLGWIIAAIIFFVRSAMD